MDVMKRDCLKVALEDWAENEDFDLLEMKCKTLTDFAQPILFIKDALQALI